jgi:hypothetical protein
LNIFTLPVSVITAGTISHAHEIQNGFFHSIICRVTGFASDQSSIFKMVFSPHAHRWNCDRPLANNLDTLTGFPFHCHAGQKEFSESDYDGFS